MPDDRRLSASAQSLAADPAHIRRARRLASRMADRAPWLRDEFESAALLALCEAARTFDPTRGRTRARKFAHHAHNRIVGAILDARRASGLVRGSRTHGLHPVTESLDRPAFNPSGRTTSNAEFIPSDDHPVGWEVESQDGVHGITDGLPGDRKRAIRLLYGDCRTPTMMQVGEMMGLTEAWVHHMVTEGYGMIRRASDGTGPALVKERALARCLRAAERLGDRASRRELVMLDSWAAHRRGDSISIEMIARRVRADWESRRPGVPPITQKEAARHAAALKDEGMFPPRKAATPEGKAEAAAEAAVLAGEPVADQPRAAKDPSPEEIAELAGEIREGKLEDKRKSGGGIPGPSPRFAKSLTCGVLSRWKGKSLAAEPS